jgi:hypothetical protein
MLGSFQKSHHFCSDTVEDSIINKMAINVRLELCH